MKSTGASGHRLPKRWGWFRLTLTFVVLWVLCSFLLVPDHPPRTALQWALWLLIPVFYLLGELVVTLLARIPPFSCTVRWVGSGIDPTDRIFRVVVLAIAFLILFFIGLGIYTHLLGI